MTPRQMAGWLKLAGEAERADAAKDLMIATLGARGEEDAVQERLQAWSNADDG